jgi:3-oxoacyl-ACP reductase-like protein
MGIFSALKDKLFGAKVPESVAPAPAAAAPAAAPTAATPAPVMPLLDVEAVLTFMASQHKGKLNWQESIVDLMTLLEMDNSLSNRRELADELGFKGDKKDTATMNVWLIKEVMRQFAANGGKVPASLTD